MSANLNGFCTASVGNLTLITNPAPVEPPGAMTSGSQAKRQASMRFVFVSGRTPADDAYCALCCEQIGETYVREMQTRLIYCDERCYRGHVTFCQLALESRARNAS